MKTIDIAKDIISLCKKNNYDFNNTKIQKLLYLFVGFCLINDVKEIYSIDEFPRLWPYGTIFSKVHKHYNSIRNCDDEIKSTRDDKTKKILEETVKKWGKISAGKLSALSRMEESPWDLLVKKGAKWNTKIDLDYIQIYFARKVENVI